MCCCRKMAFPAQGPMFDIGPKTRAAWAAEIQKAAFILWNGPVGMYEKNEYSGGTNALAEALASSSAHAVIGGGDTDEALAKVHFDPEKVFISTGGGATLEFLADGTLPGIEVLKSIKPPGCCRPQFARNKMHMHVRHIFADNARDVRNLRRILSLMSRATFLAIQIRSSADRSSGKS